MNPRADNLRIHWFVSRLDFKLIWLWQSAYRVNDPNFDFSALSLVGYCAGDASIVGTFCGRVPKDKVSRWLRRTHAICRLFYNSLNHFEFMLLLCSQMAYSSLSAPFLCLYRRKLDCFGLATNLIVDVPQLSLYQVVVVFRREIPSTLSLLLL